MYVRMKEEALSTGTTDDPAPDGESVTGNKTVKSKQTNEKKRKNQKRKKEKKKGVE